MREKKNLINMATIRNIAKRRQLAEMVYSSHTAKAYELTREEKDELGNEVGAAFKGYVQAIEDIACLFMQGKPIGFHLWTAERKRRT